MIRTYVCQMIPLSNNYVIVNLINYYFFDFDISIKQFRLSAAL